MVYLFIILFALNALVGAQLILLRFREQENNAALFSGAVYLIYGILFLSYTIVPQDVLRDNAIVIIGFYVALIPLILGLIWCLFRRLFKDEN